MLDDPTTPPSRDNGRRPQATAARLTAFPVVRFSASGLKLTPELVRAKLIAEYHLVRAETLPKEMG